MAQLAGGLDRRVACASMKGDCPVRFAPTSGVAATRSRLTQARERSTRPGSRTSTPAPASTVSAARRARSAPRSTARAKRSRSILGRRATRRRVRKKTVVIDAERAADRARLIPGLARMPTRPAEGDRHRAKLRDVEITDPAYNEPADISRDTSERRDRTQHGACHRATAELCVAGARRKRPRGNGARRHPLRS